MTHIVSPTRFPTKKSFREAVQAPGGETRVFCEDPSLFSPFSGTVEQILMERDSFTVTNHPKRSWFAMVKRTPGGQARVS